MTRQVAAMRDDARPFEPPAGVINRAVEMDAQAAVRAASYDASSHTVEAVLSAGSRVRRWGIIEELNMDPAAVDLSRAMAGQVRVIDTHDQWSIDRILGSVENCRLENGELLATIVFADTEEAQRAEALVASGHLTGISIGYSIQSWILAGEDNDIPIWRADKWTLMEASFCSVPADPVAGVRTAAGAPGPTAQTLEQDDMTRNAPAPAATPAGSPPSVPAAADAPAVAAAPAPETRAAPPAAAPAQSAAILPGLDAATAFRIAADAEAVVGPDAAAQARAEVARLAAAPGATEEGVRAAILAFCAQRQASLHEIGRPGRIDVTRDETETRRRGLEDALAIRLGAGGEPNEAARGYMAFYDLVDFAAERTGHTGRLRHAAEREDVLRRAFHSTSDFPILMENAMNRSLRARYQAQTPTYRRIAQQRTYMDFRDHIAVREGDFPQLKPVGEGGEIKAGTFSEAKEKTSVTAYGIRVGLSRQLLVNDNLGAIARVIGSRADMVARFEEETFYTMMTSATSAGPTLLETARAVFNTTDKSKAASNAAISTAAIGLGRAAMRTRKSIDDSYISVVPRILLVGPDKETEAQSYLAPIVAAAAANVNLFTGLLDLVVTPYVSGNGWYLFSDIGQGANFEWGLLEGYGAPRFRTEEPFGKQGVELSLEHDFGCGAIDYRFGYFNAGA